MSGFEDGFPSEDTRVEPNYDYQVFKNVHVIASLTIPGQWIDPMSGKSLANEAYVKQQIDNAQLELLERITNGTSADGPHGHYCLVHHLALQELSKLRTKEKL